MVPPATGAHHIRAEVHEARDHAFGADGIDQHVGGQPVLHRQHVAIRCEPVAQECRGGCRVKALHRDDGVLDRVGKLRGSDRRDRDRELVDRSLDSQAVALDRGDVVLVRITERDVVARSEHVRSDGSADRAGADNG
jgi:hypothetical protein